MSYEQLAASVDALASANTLLTDQVIKIQVSSNEAVAESESQAAKAQQAADAAQLAAKVYDTTAAGLAATVVNGYFNVVATDNKEFLIMYKNNAGAALEIKRYPSAKAVADIGIEDQASSVSGLSFAIVDDSNRRTWLEADNEGKPSTHAIQKIGEKLSADNSVTLADDITSRAVTESVGEVGIEEMPPLNEELSFSIVDENGIRTWLEASNKGRPTKNAITKIVDGLNSDAPELFDEVTANAISAVGIEEIPAMNEELMFSIVDSESHRTWLEVAPDGGPTKNAMASIIERLPEDIGGAPSTYRDNVKGALTISSGPNITCWGDSMTAGAGGGGTTYPGTLQSLLTAAGYTTVVNNRGVGGENSLTIAARAGGNPFIVLPVGGVIPATTTAFEITLLPINGLVPKPLMQGASSYTGRLGDVKGTFSQTNSNSVYTYFFTRTTAGSEVVVNRPTPMYLDIGDQARGDLNIIWIGQNGPDNTRAIQDAKAIIQRLTALDKRFLVISKPGGTTASDIEDAAWFAEFGRRFIPIRQYMVQYGLADAGITPTAQDITDMANGTVPESIRTDSVHWKAPGYIILANIVFKRLKELEWI